MKLKVSLLGGGWMRGRGVGGFILTSFYTNFTITSLFYKYLQKNKKHKKKKVKSTDFISDAVVARVSLLASYSPRLIYHAMAQTLNATVNVKPCPAPTPFLPLHAASMRPIVRGDLKHIFGNFFSLLHCQRVSRPHSAVRAQSKRALYCPYVGLLLQW